MKPQVKVDLVLVYVVVQVVCAEDFPDSYQLRERNTYSPMCVMDSATISLHQELLLKCWPTDPLLQSIIRLLKPIDNQIQNQQVVDDLGKP